MKKEDLSIFSIQLLEEKYHSKRSTFRVFLGLFIATNITLFILLGLAYPIDFMGGFLFASACFTNIYHKKTKVLKDELESRKVAFT